MTCKRYVLQDGADSASRGNAVARARAVLLAGGVIVAPTETVYGLMTLWSNSLGRECIYALKARSSDKRLQMLACDLDQAAGSGVIRSAVLERLAGRFWPGPLTSVVPATGGETIGLRIPDHRLVLELLRQLPEPIAATSANRSGQPAALDAEAAVQGLTGEVDLVIDAGPIWTGDGKASTVVVVDGDSVKLLREGPISLMDIQETLAAEERHDG